MQVDVLQIPLVTVVVVLEPDMVEVDRAVSNGERGVAFFVGDIGLFVQHFNDTLGTSDGACHHHHHHGHHHQTG